MEPTVVRKNGIISVQPPPKIPEIKGVGSTLFHSISKRRDKIGQIDAATGKEYTWGELLQSSIRTAITMRRRGITRDHVVSLCSFNCPDSCIPILASLFLGVKYANLDPTISLKDSIHLLKQVRPKILFVAPEAVKLMEDALKEAEIDADIVVFGESSKHLQFSEFLNLLPEEKDFVPVEIEDIKETAIIIFSSGTTGLPKGICLSHYGLLAPKTNNEYEPLVSGRSLLLFPSFYWISSTTTLLLCALYGGIRMVCPRFDPETTWKLITERRPDFMYLAPCHAIAMCKHERPEFADSSSLKILLLSGGPVSEEQMVELRQVFKGSLIMNTYGTTELSGNGTWWNPPKDLQEIMRKPGAIGKAVPGYIYKIVDSETEEVLGPDQKGELRVKSDFNMNGYYNIDSSDAWDKNGFIKTGDIGYYDDDYCFYIVDRIKEMLKFQSWHVVPAQLEAVLLSHSAVAAAVVFGMPHPEDGDHAMALVVLKSSCDSGITPQELEKYVNGKVADRQRLRAGVKIVKSIPVSPNGKYIRRHIRDLVIRKEL